MTMTDPITPPPELLAQLSHSPSTWLDQITIAYQCGADQELQACCEWLAYEGHEHEHLALRAARRPEPPSLKEQALEALEALPTPAGQVTADRLATIRRALEALDD